MPELHGPRLSKCVNSVRRQKDRFSSLRSAVIWKVEVHALNRVLVSGVTTRMSALPRAQRGSSKVPPLPPVPDAAPFGFHIIVFCQIFVVGSAGGYRVFKKSFSRTFFLDSLVVNISTLNGHKISHARIHWVSAIFESFIDWSSFTLLFE